MRKSAESDADKRRARVQACENRFVRESMRAQINASEINGGR